jgi:hypothetical protein
VESGSVVVTGEAGVGGVRSRRHYRGRGRAVGAMSTDLVREVARLWSEPDRLTAHVRRADPTCSGIRAGDRVRGGRRG